MIIFVVLLVVQVDKDMKKRRGGQDYHSYGSQDGYLLYGDKDGDRTSRNSPRKLFQEKQSLYNVYKDMRRDADRERLLSLGEYACKHGLSDELEWVMKQADEELKKKIQKKCKHLKK
jgi:hypothetical protein